LERYLSANDRAIGKKSVFSIPALEIIWWNCFLNVAIGLDDKFQSVKIEAIKTIDQISKAPFF
jgi:hypothetical protein